MAVPQFDPEELKIVRKLPGFFGETPIYNFPVTMKEANKALYQKKPIWQITGLEQVIFSPKVYPDNVARAFAFDGNFMSPADGGGKDMFGLDWEYVPLVGGSIVRPGKPFLADANEWYDKIVWPDIDSWAWEREGKLNDGYLGTDRFNVCWLLNGWFERLISFMDFEGAIMAMVDEDQKNAVKDFFDKLTDLYIQLVDRHLTYFPQIDSFCVHDDWGSQKETFFSPAVAAEMLVPYMKRFTDYIHSRGRYADFHSCGQNLKQVPNMIACGWDSWSGQAMNDTQKAYELYGDQIIIGVIPDGYDPMTTSEEEQRARAREYAEKFCKPGKPSIFGFEGFAMLTPVFREELYRQSRISYSAE